MAFGEALRSMNQQTIYDVFKSKDITPESIKRIINICDDLYYGRDSVCDFDQSQRIPCIIVDGFEKTVYGEYKATVDDSTAKGKKIAQLLEQYEEIREESYNLTLIGGEGFIKPVPTPDYENFMFGFIPRPNFSVFGRNFKGAINDIGTSENKIKQGPLSNKEYYYTLFERRMMDNYGYLTIVSILYESTSAFDTGNPVPLSTLDDYAYLRDEYRYDTPIGNLGIIPMKTHIPNSEEKSKDGIPVYAPAVRSIMKLYKHSSRSVDEWDVTSPMLFLPYDLQIRDDDGRLKELPKFATPVDEDPERFAPYAHTPVPNQEQLEAREQQILRDIENEMYMHRGFISRAEGEIEQRVLEVRSSMEKASHTIAANQRMCETALRDLVRTCDVLAPLLQIRGWDTSPLPELTIEWGNGILYDEDKEYQRIQTEVASGRLIPEYLLDWLQLHPMDKKRVEEMRKLMPDLSQEPDPEKEEAI